MSVCSSREDVWAAFCHPVEPVPPPHAARPACRLCQFVGHERPYVHLWLRSRFFCLLNAAEGWPVGHTFMFGVSFVNNRQIVSFVVYDHTCKTRRNLSITIGGGPCMLAAQQIFLVAQSAQGGVRLVEHFFHRTTWGPQHPRGISVRNAQKTTFRPIWTTGGKVGAQPLNRQNPGRQGGTSPLLTLPFCC